MYSVLLLTDDSVLAHGLVSLIADTDDLRLCGISAKPVDLLRMLQDNKNAVVLIDMNLSVPLSFVSDVRNTFPDCRVCLWARHIPDDLAYQAMTLGIRGILRRCLSVSDVLKSLRKLAAGEAWFDEQLMEGFFCNRVVRLTRRESQLVALVAQGLKNKEIAYRLTLSEGTVKVYLSSLFEKLGVKDRFELALYGMRNLSVAGTTAEFDASAAPQMATFIRPHAATHKV